MADIDIDTRPRAQLAATSFAIAGGALVIGTLIAVYLGMRDQIVRPGDVWVPSSVTIPNVSLGMALLTLVLSMVTMQWAVHAARHNDRPHTVVALATTLVLGAAFFNAVLFSMRGMNIGLADNRWTTLVYTLTGASLFIVIVATVYVVLMGFRTIGGDAGPSRHMPLVGAALFWHFSVATFGAIWYVVYIIK